MIGKLGQVLTLAFAINFLLVAGGVGYLVGTRKLDRDKAQAIKDIVFPSTQPAAPATQPVEADDSEQKPAPAIKLEDLLTRQAGLSAGEQVEFIQTTFDTKMAELDRRQRELDNLQKQVDLARQQLSQDRTTLSGEQQTLQQQKQEAEKLATDQGFQDTLKLYTAMPAKQAKQVFVTLDDATVMRYLRAMAPRQASKIVKEFKTPDEVSRIKRIMEEMRQSQLAETPSQ